MLIFGISQISWKMDIFVKGGGRDANSCSANTLLDFIGAMPNLFGIVLCPGGSDCDSFQKATLHTPIKKYPKLFGYYVTRLVIGSIILRILPTSVLL